MVVAKDTKIVLNFLVNPLRLTIRLRMIGRTGIALDVKKLVEITHECRYEVGTPVTNDLPRESMIPEDIVSEGSRYSKGCDLCARRDDFDHF